MTMTSLDPALLRPAPSRLSAKRYMDIALSSLILLAIWPVMLAIGLAVALTSRGPVFFVQTRVGLNGKTFRMIKFRSMYRDAEARRAEMLAQSDREGLCLKLRQDPRITPVGRVLRRWSLDELPQIFNVLKGDMSLVGPRPALVEEVRAYPEHAHLRHRVRPGITGLWQVSGRADVSFDEMIGLDLAYVRRASVRTDIWVMLRTVGAVLSGKGAY
ncbi:sugar transferase [Histidinibacterium lentulum]|uniref:Sugar transferase n=1 Tax=Histidinibacterium lentulum TaxID=2480588 RepID=A0A3N2RA38_9RHOB|nr:sugar transferase [Histidinibacterium lentulum]ROU04340.1 sugar transferase [Histidinibacterium lentulum]